jgi:hypothetical protein
MSAHISHIERSLVCQGVFVDSVTSLTIKPLQTSDLLSSATDEPVKMRAKEWNEVKDPTLCDALNRVLLMEHPGRSSIPFSLLQIPWAQYQYGRKSEEGLCGSGMHPLWNDVRSSGYLHAFNKFRKSNANFLVYGKELQYFPPEFYPHCHMGEVGEGRLVEDGNSRKVTNDLKLGLSVTGTQAALYNNVWPLGSSTRYNEAG